MKTYLFITNDLKSRENMRNQIDFLNDYHKGKNVSYQVSMKRVRAVRSISANSYYWVVLQAIASKTGDTTEDLHNEYQLMYNFSVTKSGNKVPAGTSGLDSAEFSIYVNKVKTHAKSFHEVYVADPADRHYAVWEQQTKERYDALFSSI